MPVFGRRRLDVGDTLEILNPSQSSRARTLIATGPRTQRALTAAGTKVDRGLASTYQRLVQPWQMRAFAYYDALGEVNYSSQFYSRMLAGIRLYPGIIQDDGTIEEDEDPKAQAALARIQDPGGGRSGLLSAYGRLMFLVGEAILFVSTDPDTGLEQWEMLSQQELKMIGNTYMRLRAPSMAQEEYHASEAPDDEEDAWVPVAEKGDPSKMGEAVAYRMWQRHPLYSDLADSTMKGILSICEELLLLEQAVRARLRSRLAGSGVMIIDGAVTVQAETEPVPDEDPEEDPVLAAFIDAMLTPIKDEGDASAVVPLILRADTEPGSKVADLIHHLQITDPTQLYPETGMRMECIRRMAIGLDMPPEILEGIGDVNHWGAWSIDEQTWKNHGQPKAAQLCDDLTASYYRPYLRDVDKVPDWERRVIAFDASAVINHPDRTKDAKDLYDRVAIGKKALREAAGFSDDDKPTEEERAEQIGIKTHDSSLAWFGVPTVKTGGIETAPGEVTSGTGTEGTPGPATGAEVEAGPPESPDGVPEQGGLPASASIQIGRLLGGADMGLLRAREAAGSRVWNLLKGEANSEIRAELRSVRKGDLCARLGREKVRQLGAPTERELVAGARELILDSLRFYGAVKGQQAERVADAVESHACRTLYDLQPKPLPETLGDYLMRHVNGNGG